MRLLLPLLLCSSVVVAEDFAAWEERYQFDCNGPFEHFSPADLKEREGWKFEHTGGTVKVRRARPRASRSPVLGLLSGIKDLEPETKATLDGFIAAFEKADVDAIIIGGDCSSEPEGLDQILAYCRSMLDVLESRVTTPVLVVPLRHAVGNHDILGWNKRRSGMDGSESDWGKKFACEMFGTARTWHSFDRGGWRFVCLDSVQPKGEGYVAYLDDEQYEWLKELLATTPRSTPVCVVSHIPILSLTTLTYGKPRGRDKVGEDNVIVAGEMHTDATLLHELFKAAGNVRLCLSGHIHLLDRCSIDGITYICDGAVSGAWWKGPLQGVREGFGVLDLRSDGTFDHRYETYGWTPRK